MDQLSGRIGCDGGSHGVGVGYRGPGWRGW
jgi:hypothetical protein